MSAASQRKMKPSGIDWIGDVPEGWGIVRVKYTGWYRNGLTYAPDDVCDEDEGVLVLRSSNIQGGKLDYADSVYVNKTIPRELMTRVDDIVICSRNGSSDLIGKNAIVNDKRVMTFGAFMMTYRVESYFPRFAYWMLNSCVFKYYRSLFATSTVNQLTGADFGNITVPVPPLDEQKRIAAKLGRLCGRVDELAENIKGEIAALQEYRKSLITECVTKGLNPKAKMKPSGVDWIGDIPVGWTIMRLKYACSTITDGSHFSPECVDDGYPYVTATDVRGVGIDFERTKFVSEADYQALLLPPGVLLLVMMLFAFPAITDFCSSRTMHVMLPNGEQTEFRVPIDDDRKPQIGEGWKAYRGYRDGKAHLLIYPGAGGEPFVIHVGTKGPIVFFSRPMDGDDITVFNMHSKRVFHVKRGVDGVWSMKGDNTVWVQ